MLRADGNAFLTPDTPGSVSLVCRRLTLPDYLWRYFQGAYGELIESGNWYQFGNMPIDDIVTAFIEALDNMTDCHMIGSIIPFARETLPHNCLPCNGASYARADYPLLYAALPSHLITSSDTFVTPDLRGRFLLADGNGRLHGQTGGEESHTLTIGEMPTHTHGHMGAVESVTTIVVPDAPSALAAPMQTAPEGGNMPHNNMPPYYTVIYGIVAE